MCLGYCNTHVFNTACHCFLCVSFCGAIAIELVLFSIPNSYTDVFANLSRSETVHCNGNFC